MGYFLQDSHGKQIQIGLCMWIGFDPSNHFIVSDLPINPCHAILGDFPDGLLLRDENSPTGTFVNGEKIEHVVALKAGDQVMFRKSKFTIGRLETPPTLRETANPTIRVESPSTVQTVSHKTAAQEKSVKKSGGCLTKALIILLILIVSCVALGGTAYLLMKNGVIPQRMADLAMGSGNAQINMYNFTDQVVYVKMIQKFDNENTITIPDIYWTMEPFGSESDLNFSGSGQNDILTIGTTKDGSELGSCILFTDARFTYNFVILKDKVLVDRVQYPEIFDKPPTNVNDLILSTTSLCK